MPTRYQSCFRPSYGPYLDAKFGIDGTLYVVSAASDLGPPFQPYVAASSDLGATWRFTMLAQAEEKDWKLYDGTTVKALENYQATRMAVSPVDENVVIAGFAYYGRGNWYNNAPAPRLDLHLHRQGAHLRSAHRPVGGSAFPADKGGIDYPYIVVC